MSCRGTSKFSTSSYYYLECAYLDIPWVPKIRSLHIFTISPEKHGDKVVLLPVDKYQSFLKMILSFWVCATRVTQRTQNNKFAILLQYLKENGKNEVYFLLADKHQSFLQIHTIILGVWPGMPKLPKITSLLFLSTWKKWVMKLVFFACR